MDLETLWAVMPQIFATGSFIFAAYNFWQRNILRAGVGALAVVSAIWW